MKRFVLLALLAACQAKVIDLGIDAPADTHVQPPPDGSPCRCRITPCRLAVDCVLTGGTCGPDFYCTGDFGACSVDAQCKVQNPDGVCTKATDSTAACP